MTVAQFVGFAEPIRERRGDAETGAEARRPVGASVPHIRIVNVAKRFAGASGEVTALNGVSLDIERGEIFGVIGRSGAGKSTLIRCVNRLERPTSGTVLIDDREITDLAPDELVPLRQRIGMIFQHFNLLSSRTVLENVALPLKLAGRGRRERTETALELLELVGLSDKRDAYPAALSGGQKQRVGIARALVHKPEILLCDEATSALDPETTLAILALLKRISRDLGLTILLITHEMAVVREICDRVAVMEAGRVAELGPVRDVFTHPGAEITRRLLQSLTPELPASVIDRLNPTPTPGDIAILRLAVGSGEADDVIVSRLARDLDRDVRIIRAAIGALQDRSGGFLTLGIACGDPGERDRILTHPALRHAEPELLGYVRDLA